MHEDSPPPFIVIRTPRTQPAAAPYERSLELVAVVHDLLGNATTRFYLKDRLDRATTSLVFSLGRAARAVSSVRWRDYRLAEDSAAELGTILDILVAQKAAPQGELERAQALVRELLALLAPRSNG